MSEKYPIFLYDDHTHKCPDGPSESALLKAETPLFAIGRMCAMGWRRRFSPKCSLEKRVPLSFPNGDIKAHVPKLPNCKGKRASLLRSTCGWVSEFVLAVNVPGYVIKESHICLDLDVHI